MHHKGWKNQYLFSTGPTASLYPAQGVHQWASSRLWELGRLGGLGWRTSLGFSPQSLVFSPPPFLVIQDLLTNVKS